MVEPSLALETLAFGSSETFAIDEALLTSVPTSDERYWLSSTSTLTSSHG